MYTFKELRDFLKNFEKQSNLRCKNCQCYASSKKNERCKLCLNAVRAQTNQKSCHVHEKLERTLKYLNRKGKIVIGFDENLLVEKTKWFADDAMTTALKILSKSRNVNFFLITPRGETVEINKNQTPLSVAIVLFKNHWFVVSRKNEPVENNHAIWNVYDSFEGYLEQSSRELLYFLKSKFVVDSLIFETNLPQQTNPNDCGPFAIYFAACLTFLKTPKKTFPQIRLAALNFLMFIDI